MSIDFTTKYKDFLLEQFKDSENLNKLFYIEGLQANSIQNLFLEVYEKYYLDNAVGEQLNTIGSIIGIDRDGGTDDRYRTLIRLKIKINLSAGQPPIFIEAIKELFAATFVHYIQNRNEESGIAQIYTDGSLLLTDEFNGITEDSDNLLFDTFGDFNLITEDGYSLNTENLNPLIVYDTGAGNQSIFTTADDIDESILYDILPSGVGFYLLGRALTESLDYLITEAGDTILF